MIVQFDHGCKDEPYKELPKMVRILAAFAIFLPVAKTKEQIRREVASTMIVPAEMQQLS